MLVVSFLILWSIFISSYSVLYFIAVMEFFVLIAYYFFSSIFTFMGGDLMMIISFLCFMVCEGCLGLGIIVSMVRSFGEDYISNFFLL